MTGKAPAPSRPPRRFLRRLRALFVVAAVTLLAALGLRLLLFTGPYLPPEPVADGRIVDMHCHTAGLGAGDSGCRISDELRDSYKFAIYLRAFGLTREQVQSEGDAVIIRRISEMIAESLHVDAAIVLALDGAVDESGELDLERTEVYVPNEFVARETARYENLHFGASINPLRSDALERLAWAHENGARLIKWLPAIQLFDPADERIRPFYQRMAELEIPLLSHAGQERSFTHARDELGDPERLKLALECGIRVIVAHIASTGEAGGERCTDRLRRLLPEHAHLYSDISSLTQLNKPGYLREALIHPEFEGRLLYGTDFPLIDTPLVSAWYFPLNLRIGQIRAIESIVNPWDRDIALKQALGVPASVFLRSGEWFEP